MMVADKLLVLRKRAGLSQQAVADAVGVTRQTVSNWELGQGAPALDKAADLAHLYGVSLDDLASDEVEIVSSSRPSRERDLHVLRGLIGKVATIYLNRDDPAVLQSAVILDVDDGWMRVEHNRATAVFGKPKVERDRMVRLLDMADIRCVSVEGE